MQQDIFRLIGVGLLASCLIVGCEHDPGELSRSPIGSWQTTGSASAGASAAAGGSPRLCRLPPVSYPVPTDRGDHHHQPADEFVQALVVQQAQMAQPAVVCAVPGSVGTHRLLSGAVDFERDMSATGQLDVIEQQVTREQLARLRLPIEIARRVSGMLYDGDRLAERGATFAAERLFQDALRLVAESLDAQLGMPYHTRALSRGLRALSESEDFAMISPGRAAVGQHLAGFIVGHTTPVMKQLSASELTPNSATRRYHDYAYENLAVAGGNQPLGSEALFACGQILTIQAEKGSLRRGGAAGAIPYLQAAVTVNSKNTRAANELGVLLARQGRLHDAIHVLQFSAKVAPTTLVLANLADAHARAGNAAEAEQVRMQAIQLGMVPEPEAARASRVVWVEPDVFKDIGAIPTSHEVAAAQQKSSELQAQAAADQAAHQSPSAPPNDATPRSSFTRFW